MGKRKKARKTWLYRAHQIVLKWHLHAIAVLGIIVIGAGALSLAHAATDYSPVVGKASKCLDNQSQRKTDGNKIQLYHCNGTSAQQWNISDSGVIKNANGYCLDVDHAGATPGTLVKLLHCNNTVAQVWRVDSANHTIINPNSGLCLDDKGGVTADGNQIQAWTCDGTESERWSAPRLASPTPTPKPTPIPPTASGPCSSHATPPAHYDHIIWILEENRSLKNVIGNSQAPYLTKLARQCGYSTKFVDNNPDSEFGSGTHSVIHYISALSGGNCIAGNSRTGKGCLTNSADHGPATRNLPTKSLFEQVTDAHMTWKSYQESAPKNCYFDAKTPYMPWHDGTLYYTNIRKDCAKNDVPIPALAGAPKGALISDIKNNTLPNFAYVTPNLNNDMHNKGPKEGDAWLKAYLEPLFQSATYKAGRTAVFITWDEAMTATDTLPNLVIAPTAHTGAVGDTMNAFSVLGATENMFGLPLLGCATGTPAGGLGQCYGGAAADLRQIFGM